MAGLGSLIQGFQQGYQFVDDMERSKSDDKFKGEQRDRLRKDWEQSDEYESARKALVAKHFGAEADKPAPAADANPSRVLAMQQGAAPQAGAVAAPEVAVTPIAPAPVAAVPVAAAPVAAPQVAGAGRGFVNPPTVTAADRSVAPGNVDLARMTPDQKQNLMALAEKQFGLRTRPAGAAMAQGGAVQNVSAPMPAPGVKLAADGVEQPVQTMPAKVDPMQDMNKTLNFALESAKLDVQYGKKDGAGLITLAKTVEAMKREGMDQAIKLLGQGRYDEAQTLFNSQGEHKGTTIVSAQDATFNIGKTAIPTKIVTVRQADGSTRTINTAEAQYQMIDMAKQIEAAQRERAANITEKHYDDVREDRKLDYADRQADRKAVREDRAEARQERREDRAAATPAGKIKQIEEVMGPLSAPDKLALQRKMLGIGKDTESREKFYSEVVKEGVKGGTIQPQDAGKALTRLVTGDRVADDEGVISRELINNKADPTAYAKSYEMATKIMPPARLKELGFEPPKLQKTAGTGAKLAQAGAEPKAKQSWSETVAAKESQYQAAAGQKAKVEADPELQDLQRQKKAAAARGDLASARQFLEQHDALKAQRYGS